MRSIDKTSLKGEGRGSRSSPADGSNMTHHDPADRAFSRSSYTVVAIVALLVAVHLFRMALDEATDFRFLADLAFVPAQFTMPLDREGVLQAASQAVAQGDMQSSEAALLLGAGVRWWTPLTYALLHGGFAHIALNSVWLLAFGTAVCRRFGSLRFIAFFIVTAVAGALAHYIVHPYGLAPVIGASAAISGAMGAAVRFAFTPGAPLGPGFSRPRDLDAYRQLAPALREVLTERRAMTFLVFWFVLNLLFGVYTPVGDGAIAWEAHIGGFLAGFLLFNLFDPTPSAAPR